MLGLDIETAGDEDGYALQPWRLKEGSARITLVGIGNHSDVRQLDHGFTRINDMKPSTFVGWNTVFDAAWLYAAGVDISRHKWIDARLIVKWVVNGQANEAQPSGYWSLGTAAERELKDWPLKDVFLKLKNSDVKDGENPRYWKARNKLDVLATIQLYEKYWAQLTTPQKRAALIEASNIVPAAISWVNGIHTNPDVYEEAQEPTLAAMHEIEDRLGVRTSADAPSEILRSPKKLQELLYGDWGLECETFTGKGQPSTSKAALTYLADNDDRLLDILAWRVHNTTYSKFLQSPAKVREYLGSTVFHPQPRIFSTYTGRYTYSSKCLKKYPVGMALHQMPRNGAVRDMVKVPENKVLIEFDAAGQEARLLAEVGSINTLKTTFLNGVNYHTETGAAITGYDYDTFNEMVKSGDARAKEMRYAGKFCIAKGQLVDTDKGAVPIENVTALHRVWDGVEFVKHDGVVCLGEKGVITRDGVTATPDHKVLTTEGWTNLEDTIDGSIIRSNPRYEGSSVRSLDSSDQKDTQKEWRYTRRLPLRMWCTVQNIKKQFSTWKNEKMRIVPPKKYDSVRRTKTVHSKILGYGSQMHQPTVPLVPELRCQRGKSKFYERRFFKLHGDALPWGRPEIYGYRSYRQPRTLRAWEPTLSRPEDKFKEQAEQPRFNVQEKGYPHWSRLACTKVRKSILRVHTPMDFHTYSKRSFNTRDKETGQDTPPTESKAVVYDIINAGPRNRFTIQGRIVSNCNLSFQYRVGMRKARVQARVQYGIVESIATIQGWKSRWLQQHPGVKLYWHQAPNNVKAKGYAETLAGRRYYIDDWSEDGTWPSASSAINFPIQGSGADMKNLAIKHIYENHPELEFAWELHDGLFYWADKTKASIELAVQVRKELDELDYLSAWGYTPEVPLLWDLSVGSKWSKMREL